MVQTSPLDSLNVGEFFIFETKNVFMFYKKLVFYFLLFIKIMFGFWKILRKEKKNVKKSDFFIFCCFMKNIKENKI